MDGQILWSDAERVQQRNQLVLAVITDFKPKFSKIPFASWKRRSAAIKQQPNEMLALNRYQDLRDSMAYLENTIGEMALSLDRHIQLKIDEARGK